MTVIIEVHESVEDMVAGNVIQSASGGNAANALYKLFKEYMSIRVDGDGTPANLSWPSIIDHFSDQGYLCSIRKFGVF